MLLLKYPAAVRGDGVAAPAAGGFYFYFFLIGCSWRSKQQNALTRLPRQKSRSRNHPAAAVAVAAQDYSLRKNTGAH